MTARETTLGDIGEMIERGFKAVADDIGCLDTRLDDIRTEMIDQFEHVDKQFETTYFLLRDVSSELAVIHRRNRTAGSTGVPACRIFKRDRSFFDTRDRD